MSIHYFATPLELKALGGDGTFMGYASVFGTVDAQNESVAPGAFERSLSSMRRKNRSPAMLWMHDPTVPVGVWVAIGEDAKGLAVQGRLALSTQKGREAYELLKMKALTGLSIGYRVVSSRIDKKKKVRVLTDVELFEISLVTFPANDVARVSEVKAPRRIAKGKRKTGKLVARQRKGETEKAMTRVVVARLHRAAKALKDTTKKQGENV